MSQDTATTENQVTLGDILELGIDTQASDLHFGANERIGLRINGKICFVDNIPPLTPEQAEKIIFDLLPNDEQKETLLRTREMDTSFEYTDGTSFRVNVFYKKRNISAVLRRIPREAFTMDNLGVPDAVSSLLSKKQGLILVTGPTGSGKSTTMQSMLEYINQNRVEHILTIEDPIEFLFTSKKYIFSQREVGDDTLSFANALKAALREDPDVVMIGEMRDPETIMAAMNLAETGHLVISTLHTSSAAQTVSRLVNAFPGDQQNQVKSRLADSLVGVVSQRLIPRCDKAGRIAIFELMIINAALRNIIRSGDTGQIANAIQAGRGIGMIKMETYAEELRLRNIVRPEDYMHYFTED
ncbi:MAG: PilT/PilU family type 4a pilus ATPase [Candidatus Gracilibacteria bacterium]|nr:PilT/PilU family type 4a pilus ATPase [Candidatus Gracilibacteria bacterium]